MKLNLLLFTFFAYFTVLSKISFFESENTVSYLDTENKPRSSKMGLEDETLKTDTRENGRYTNAGDNTNVPILGGLLINEFMASNNSTDIPGHSGSDDWIELRNTTSSAIDISGFYITDDFSNPTKVRLPTAAGSVVIPANGYLVLICSDNPSLGARHITLGLSASGEEIGLYAANGTTMIDTVSFGSQRADISMGRHPTNTSQWKYFKTTTPGKINSIDGMYDSILPAPVFSHQGGFFATPFNLQLSTDVPGATIYYTLDGSEPDVANAGGKTFKYKNTSYGPLLNETMKTNLYGSPISIYNRTSEPNKVSVKSSSWGAWSSNWYFPNSNVAKGTVVKAIVSKPGGLSEVLAHTYFVFPNAESRYSFPVVSISMDESNMFDYYKGFYTPGVNGREESDNYGNFTKDFRYSGNFEYFENNIQVINRAADYKIHGAKSIISPKKSMRVYGGSGLNHPIFKNHPERNHRNIILRASGASSEGSWYVNVFKDWLNQEIFTGLNFSKQEATPSVVFINGEYWGIHHAIERIDKHYINEIFGVNKDSLDIIQVSDHFGVEEGSLSSYYQLESYLANNNVANLNIYNEVRKLVDIDNVIDYFAAQLFIANTDWPNNNVRIWRKKLKNNVMGEGYNDGRWRWILYDTDATLRNFNYNSLGANLNQNNSSSRYIYILERLLTNSSFKEAFLTRFSDLLNSYFTSNRTTQVLTDFKARYDIEMPENIERWKDPTSSVWNLEVNGMANFYSQRPVAQRNHLRSFFSLSSQRNLTVNVSDALLGYVKVNTIDILPTTPGVSENPYPWTGIYFQGIPVKLEAKLKKGSKFRHWLKDGVFYSGNPIITINLIANETYTAVYQEHILSANPFPVAKVLDECGFKFTEWSASSAVGTHPDNMAFVYFNPITAGSEDHFFADTLGGFTTGLFNHTNRSRISGLGADGVSFINTGGPADHPGYPASRMGGLLLALNTTGQDSVYVSWTGGTVLPNLRDYAIRLQYRRGDLLDFKDVLDSAGQPIEYNRHPEAGHSQVFENIKLPEELNNQPYVQLLWNYYFKGTVRSGARAQLRIDDIDVFSKASYNKGTNQTALISRQGSISSKATVNPVGMTEYKATKHILLEPGFNTTNAAVFKAEIKMCLN
jgi:hypothetical protein